MERDFSKLRGRIVEKYRNVGKFAEAIGVPLPVISAKLNGTKPITHNDVMLWADPLDINVDEIGVYFFTKKV